MTLSNNIDTISTSLDDIKDAIEAKGVTVSGNITTYATAIENISGVNNTTLSVTPTTSAQSFTASGSYTGYSTVSVGAVTSAIDSNIAAGNIKKDVTVLGVTGTYEGSGGGSNDCMLSISIWDDTLRTNDFDSRNYPITNIKFNNVSYFDKIGYYGASSNGGYDFKGNILLQKNTSITCEITLASDVTIGGVFLNDSQIYQGSNTVTFTLSGDSTLSITLMAEGGVL